MLTMTVMTAHDGKDHVSGDDEAHGGEECWGSVIVTTVLLLLVMMMMLVTTVIRVCPVFSVLSIARYCFVL